MENAVLKESSGRYESSCCPVTSWDGATKHTQDHVKYRRFNEYRQTLIRKETRFPEALLAMH